VTWILGLDAYHADSSACLLQDGKLVAAAEEERFRRLEQRAGGGGRGCRGSRLLPTER
jgi:carbamoyltransferase